MNDFVHYQRIPSDNPLLGRNIEEDLRSRAFRPALLEDSEDVKSVRHNVNIPVLSQVVGSCTCNNQINMIASDQIWATLSQPERDAIALAPNAAVLDWYREVTRTDEFTGAWEPEDTGSSGTSASKVTVRRGYASGFVNGYSRHEGAIMLQRGTIGMGSWWYSSFDRPASDGRVAIAPGAYRAGGHQYTGVELDLENRRVVWRNSWDDDWGVDGEFWYDFETWDRLIAEHGDIVQLVPKSLPQPEPDWDQMLYDEVSPWAYGRLFSKLTKAGKASTAFKIWAEKKIYRA